MEPAPRIELGTDGLRNRCSTAELRWRQLQIILFFGLKVYNWLQIGSTGFQMELAVFRLSSKISAAFSCIPGITWE